MLLSRLFRAKPETKASKTGPLLALSGPGRPVWTPRDYGALAREGYARNPVVYRAIRMVSEAAASVPIYVRQGSRDLDEHPLLALLDRPSPGKTRADLIEAMVTHLLIAGNAYVEAAIVDGRVSELHPLRPDRVRIVPGADGRAVAYDYRVGSEEVRLSQTTEPVPSVLHVALPNPTHDHYGLAPLEAAQVSIDVLNAAAAWSKALLDNSARPSGALVYAPTSGASLTREQVERLKAELEEGFSGAANAGRPLLLEGGLDWKALSLTPRDMDFAETRATAAREVALAFGVPPVLLGLKGDTTYRNLEEANRALWRSTVLPTMARLLGALDGWLGEAFGGIRLHVDKDAIEALAGERAALWKRVGAADFLTEDEKRVAVGYGPKPEAS
jgi:HK97 family phage portal protein